MRTKILLEAEISIAVDLLRRGEPVGMPTETVYGLAAPVFDLSAVNKIFSLKGRPADNPLIVHVSSLDMVHQVSIDLPPEFFLLTSQFWPGPLTLILPKQPGVPLLATGGQQTVAVRMPAHPIALQLIKDVGVPLAAPSANLSGKPSPTSAEHVREDFEGKLAAIIDGGECQFGLESTVLSLVHERPVLLRPGTITRSQLECALGRTIDDPQTNESALSPGMKYRHYAPEAPIYIVSDPAKIQSGFVISRTPIPPFSFRPLNPFSFYSHLREADRTGVKEIWVLLDSISANDEALMNRLEKATSIPVNV